MWNTSFHSSPPTMTLPKMEIPHVTWALCHVIIVYHSHFLTPSNPGASNTQLVLFPACFHTPHCLLLPKPHGWSTLSHISFTARGCTHLSFVVLYLLHRLKVHFPAAKRSSGHSDLLFIPINHPDHRDVHSPARYICSTVRATTVPPRQLLVPVLVHPRALNCLHLCHALPPEAQRHSTTRPSPSPELSLLRFRFSAISACMWLY